ncbi:MAG TPA: hypothetical protein PLH07_04805 [Sulfurovum sp.]|jgi:uncharacterized small protein (DUF1192 family)|nr:hypothetical protein [Sulfurovum sp.]HQS78573.1 hypothetical protein [Sulfurovum sp.]HQT28598.1 hypothetical protein [Sulfurovum sp.]
MIVCENDEYEKIKDVVAFQEYSELKSRIAASLDEMELIKADKKKAYPIDTLWDEL